MQIEFFKKNTLIIDSAALEVNVTRINDYPYHWHEDLEILLVLQGSITLYASALVSELPAGSVEIISVNEIHRIIGDKDNIVLSLKIKKDLVEEFIPNVSTVIFDSNFLPESEVAKQIQSQFGKILCSFCLFLYGKKDKLIDSEVRVRIQEILTFMKDQFDIVSKVLNIKYPSPSDRDTFRPRYSRVVEYILNNFSQRVGLQDLADQENLSLFFLSRAIKELFGNGFQELMNYQRVHYSMKLLLNADFNITDIAFECGYSAPRYLRKNFEEFLGLTPLNFRKKFRQELDNIDPHSIMDDIETLSALKSVRDYSRVFWYEDNNPSNVLDLDYNAVPLSVVDWVRFRPVSDLKITNKKNNTSSPESLIFAFSKLKHLLVDPNSNPDNSFCFDSYGLKTPLWFVYSLLSQLGQNILVQQKNILVCRQGCAIQVLVYNSPENPLEKEEDRLIKLNFHNFEGEYQVVRKFCNKNNISAYHKIIQLGMKEPSSQDISIIDSILIPEVQHSFVSGLFELKLILPPSSLELLTFIPIAQTTT